MGRKPGVSEPADLAAFVAKAADKIIVVDARNTGAQCRELKPIAPLNSGAMRCSEEQLNLSSDETGSLRWCTHPWQISPSSPATRRLTQRLLLVAVQTCANDIRALASCLGKFCAPSSLTIVVPHPTGTPKVRERTL